MPCANACLNFLLFPRCGGVIPMAIQLGIICANHFLVIVIIPEVISYGKEL